MLNYPTGDIEVDRFTPEGEMDKPEIDRGELKSLLLSALLPRPCSGITNCITLTMACKKRTGWCSETAGATKQIL